MKSQPGLPVEEIARRGNEIYARLRARMETPENIGKVIVMDVESGRYAVADTAHAANDLARDKAPNGEFYAIRIGYPAVESIGGWLRPTEPV